MILEQDPVTGYWTHVKGVKGLRLSVHNPHDCKGELCDVHNRRGDGEQVSWTLNWREDRGFMEVYCHHGTGHPTPAQHQFWDSVRAPASERVHACDGCCSKWFQGKEETLIKEKPDPEKSSEGAENDPVNPNHYKQHPKGIEAIEYIEANPFFNLGSAQKYIHRVSWGSKDNDKQDLQKAIWFIEREIGRRWKD